MNIRIFDITLRISTSCIQNEVKSNACVRVREEVRRYGSMIAVRNVTWQA